MKKERFFGISYTFKRDEVQTEIERMVDFNQKGYICVADGVTLSMSHRDGLLKKVLDESAITVCDSGWVPLYLRSLYKINREQYCGSDLLMDVVSLKKYKLMFLGASQLTLDALKQQLSLVDQRILQMPFISLPFRNVLDFDYKQIAEDIKLHNPDVIFISLGMPKQELFMHYLLPYLEKGVLIGVGAAFKFHSGLSAQKRAPKWMIKAKMEWLHRIYSEPKKQLKRCGLIISSMPFIYIKEYHNKQKNSL
ncbi:WecB/TagA/CpsF family glycosyltransferase [Bacteroidales bacterium OttesenSCG-928-M06]|nr:WecB/TagA/CpsF family glycosyltransferase [Bacteroidales bacterium OttesenSCG-928-M06]